MRMNDDSIPIIDGDETLAIRLKPPMLEAIQRAAALSGMDEASFAAGAAHRQALATLEATKVIHLQSEDYAVFTRLPDRPPTPTEALKAAFERYKRTVSPQ